MSTWWQVYVNGTVFGFKTNSEFYIVDHPEWKWKHSQLKDYKVWLLNNNAQVWKIADVQS